jgi:hypothetical protein
MANHGGSLIANAINAALGSIGKNVQLFSNRSSMREGASPNSPGAERPAVDTLVSARRQSHYNAPADLD